MSLRLTGALIACLCFLTPLPAPAAEPAPLGALQAPLWLRTPAISPDGRQVAFSFQGGLYLVAASGGPARLLVANGRRSHSPVWSPDGQRIAFAADVYGNDDVFVVAADGGPARRLTTHSSAEVPTGFTPDGREVLFAAQRLDDRRNVLFPTRAAGELYKVSVEGGRRPVQVLTTPALAARYDRAGTRLLYEDWKGYEDPWRKHHVSPVARDIWLYETASGRHRRLTDFGGEDRDPVWAPDEQAVYYLSERSGSFNVWRMPLAQPGAAVQLTFFERHPVRFLSVSSGGDLAFAYDGELYTLAAGSREPKKLAVQVTSETRGRRVERLTLSQGATEFSLSPDGKQVAFVVRGEVFVASTEFGDTRRITDTPTQERSVSFSPDGRRLVFAGERDGAWNLYEATLPGPRKDAPNFYAAPQVAVRTLLANGHENFQPRWSPDGKEVAYLEDRTTLKVLDLASGRSRLVLPGDLNYSYSDGDQWFDWSPDGRWLLVTFLDRQRWSYEAGLIDAQGKGPLRNLTHSGYEDQRPTWARGGRQMLWLSDRQGLHGTGGLGQADVFAMFFTREAFDRFNLDKAEYALLKEREEADEKKKDDSKDAKAPAKGAAKDAKDAKKAPAKEGADAEEPVKLPDPVALEFDGLDDRVVRLTPNSGTLRAMAMTPDGETLLVLQQTADALELWLQRPREKDLRRIAAFPTGEHSDFDAPPTDLQLDAKGENGFVLVDGSLHKFKLPKEDGPAKPEPVKFSAELNLDAAAERAYLFEHVWRQTLKKLYVADMNGVDWAFYRRAYERFLPYIANDQDFAECLSEMLGELNVSHTGAGHVRHAPGDDATAALGAFFDPAHAGPGLKIAEVMDGGPLQTAGSAARAGVVIERIDGVVIAPGMEVDSLLNRKAGKRVALTLFDPASGRRTEQTVRAISGRAQGELLYRRWVRTQRETVDRLSGGRVGYVHVRGMDDESYRDTFAEVLGRHSAKQALIVDTRFNGGGNLHDELAMLLSGRRYLQAVPRGQEIGWEPAGRWTKPSLVLISESNYSDAHLFPWVYQHFRIGPLLGMPVAGTGTAVWWETLQNDSLYFGIPQVGYRDQQGNYMEKALVKPDILVPNDPAALGAGRDEQLEAAVRELLK
ncbi:MAG: PD40 domain-containing protein [Piscinibacter sp.]|nr:PD40 domain-containing protein [Piscinibacter sp.]